MLSVTRILTIAGRLDRRFYSEEARERGVILHDATERFDRGERVVVPSPWIGYLEAYQTFRAETHVDYGVPTWWATLPALAQQRYGLQDGTHTERVVESARYGYRGRIDRICRNLFGHPAIVDLKFGQPAAWHGEQLALYNRLCPIGPRFGVYFKANSTYSIVRYDDPRDDVRALADLNDARLLETDDGWLTHLPPR